MGANVTLLTALNTLGKSRANAVLSDRNQAVISDLRSGSRLSESLATRFPEFPVYVLRLADLGESTGALSKALGDAADRLEYEEAVATEFRSALTYPAFLLCAGGAIIILMFAFVVPRFAGLLGDSLDRAPWISRQVIGLGMWLNANAAVAMALAGAVVVGVFLALRSDQVRQGLRDQLAKAPVIGDAMRKARIGGWCRTVGVAIENGAQLVDALRLGEQSAPASRFSNRLADVRRYVRGGRPLEEALADADLAFDPVVLDLIHTGRNAGALGEMLLFAADMAEKDLREATRRMISLAEPLAIVFISLIVGAVVISIVLSMTTLYDFNF